MLRRLTPQQFFGWMHFAEIEPLERDLYQLALIAQTIVNMNRDTKKHPDPFTLSEFLLDFCGDRNTNAEREKTWQEMKAATMAFAIASEGSE